MQALQTALRRIPSTTALLLASLLLAGAPVRSHAAIVEHIWHVFSRACLYGPDETITYNLAMVTRTMATISNQYIVHGGRMFLFKIVTDDYRDTARSYAGSCCHPYATAVGGTHMSEYPRGHRYVMYQSSAVDCNPSEY